MLIQYEGYPEKCAAFIRDPLELTLINGDIKMDTKPSYGEVCWNELATSDLKGAKDFYSKLFGWTFTDHDMGEMTYTMIKKGDKEFGGIWAIPKDQTGQIPPHWMTYVLVKNVDDALQQVEQLKGKVMKPATNVSDFGRFAIITDPTGAHIALWQTLKSMA